MARPTVDKAIRPCTRPGAAHTRLALARRAINESAYVRIDTMIRTRMSLTEAVSNLSGDMRSATRLAESGNVDAVRSWVVTAVAEGLALLACFEPEPEKHA